MIDYVGKSYNKYDKVDGHTNSLLILCSQPIYRKINKKTQKLATELLNLVRIFVTHT